MKKKLTVKEQIEHIKRKGIQFNIVTEEEAEEYLINNTYYFKLKAYAKNYDKYRNSERKGQYVNLEFAYLMDLATIDMHLRHLILRISVDLEHALKTRFLKDFNQSDDDGYEIVREFLNGNPEILDAIKLKSANSYVKDLADKLFEDDFAIWNIIELLSLKDFLKLYESFYAKYPEVLSGHNMYYPMQGIRKLRNAAAHNNCLINSLKKPYTGRIRYNNKVDTFVSRIPSLDRKSIKNNMSNQVIYDFITMIYVIDDMVLSADMKKTMVNDIHSLVHGRMIRNADYYRKESSICSAYEFVKKVVDFLYDKIYNNYDI